MSHTVQQLVEWYDDLKRNRGTAEARWQKMSVNVLGRRNFQGGMQPDVERMQQIFDTTAYEATEKLAAAIHTMLTNVEARWFYLTFEDPDLARFPMAQQWGEMVTERMKIAFAKPAANFAPQAHEVYFDLTAFGTGVQYMADIPGSGTQFSARPLSETYLSEAWNGRVDTVARCFEITARQAVETFGDNAPKHARVSLKNGKPEEKSEYLHFTTPNLGVIPGNLDASGMPYNSYYIDLKDKEQLGEVSGYWTFPWQTPRWSKDSHEIYGRGPGDLAMPDAMMLNQMSRTSLKAAHKAVDPPMFAPNTGFMSNLRQQAGGVSIVEQRFFERMQGQPIGFAPVPANIGLGVEMEERRAKQIRRAYHHEMLQMFEDPRMTATQVLELMRTAQRMLSPVLGRQRVEYLEPMLDRMFDVEFRAGRLPPIPEVLAGQNIKIEYISPVSRAQEADEAGAVERWMGRALEMAASGVPDALDIPNFDEGLRFLAEANTIPMKIVNDPRVVQALREQRAQQQAAQQQFEMMNQAGQTAARLLPAEAKARQINEAQAA